MIKVTFPHYERHTVEWYHPFKNEPIPESKQIIRDDRVSFNEERLTNQYHTSARLFIDGVCQGTILELWGRTVELKKPKPTGTWFTVERTATDPSPEVALHVNYLANGSMIMSQPGSGRTHVAVDGTIRHVEPNNNWVHIELPRDRVADRTEVVLDYAQSVERAARRMLEDFRDAEPHMQETIRRLNDEVLHSLVSDNTFDGNAVSHHSGTLELETSFQDGWAAAALDAAEDLEETMQSYEPEYEND